MVTIEITGHNTFSTGIYGAIERLLRRGDYKTPTTFLNDLSDPLFHLELIPPNVVERFLLLMAENK